MADILKTWVDPKGRFDFWNSWQARFFFTARSGPTSRCSGLREPKEERNKSNKRVTVKKPIYPDLLPPRVILYTECVQINRDWCNIYVLLMYNSTEQSSYAQPTGKPLHDEKSRWIVIYFFTLNPLWICTEETQIKLNEIFSFFTRSFEILPPKFLAATCLCNSRHFGNKLLKDSRTFVGLTWWSNDMCDSEVLIVDIRSISGHFPGLFSIWVTQ